MYEDSHEQMVEMIEDSVDRVLFELVSSSLVSMSRALEYNEAKLEIPEAVDKS